jgi:hypothetical protein
MTRKIKQYKPIGFGDRPDSGTVEDHRKAMAEATETRAYNRRMKELAARMQRDVRACLPGCLDSSSRSRGDTDVLAYMPSKQPNRIK